MDKYEIEISKTVHNDSDARTPTSTTQVLKVELKMFDSQSFRVLETIGILLREITEENTSE